MIFNFNANENPALNVVGGKAKNLIATTQAGLPVPGGLALAVSFFQAWTDDIKTGEAWKTLLSNPNKEKENAELELEKHKQFLSVQKALKELLLKYQEVISLKYFENLKIKEISIVLNKKEGTIKSLLSRGISQLKEKL